METLAALGHGFAVALTPMNLFWSALGVTVGTAVGVLPGIGPALTVALLLPVTYNLEPTSAFIMFAGIYYGAMYGGSTTAILLNTPGEIGLDRHRDRRPRDGQEGSGCPGAGDGRDRLLHRRHHRHHRADLRGTLAGQAGAAVRPGRVLRAHGPGAGHRHRRARRLARRAGSPACSSAWRWAWSASTCRPGRRGSRWASPRLLDGIDTVVVAVGLFAIGETLYVASRHRFETEEIYAIKGSMWMSREDWRALLEALAARHRVRLPDRRSASRRQRDPDLPLLPDREEAYQAPRGVRQGRDRGRGRARGRQQRRRRRRAGALALARPADLGHRRDHARRVPAVRAAARAAAVREQPRAGLGHDRQPLHRQRAPARAQPADGPGLGEAAQDPAALALRRHPGLRHARRLHAQQQRGRPRHPVDHRPDRLRHARARRAGRTLPWSG